MKAAVAIKRFLEADPNGTPTGMSDLTAMKRECKPGEWEQMGRDACDALGVEFTPSDN